MSRSAPSSPVLGVRDQETLCVFRILRSGGGVCGGKEEILVEASMLKLWTGISASSSSLASGDACSSGIVEVSDMKDSCVMPFEGNRACFGLRIGEDSANLWLFFQDICRDAVFLSLRPVNAPEDEYLCISVGRILLLP